MMENIAAAVFDDLLTQWDGKIHESEWARAMSQLEEFFLTNSAVELAEKRRAISNGMFVARTNEDWEKVLEFLRFEPLALHPGDQGSFFSNCPLEGLANFVVSESGLFNTSLSRLSGLEILADNSGEEIRLLHFSYDALEFLALSDEEWKSRQRVGVDLMNRLCLLKGGVPGSLREKFANVLRPPAQDQEKPKIKPVATQSAAPVPRTAPARTLDNNGHRKSPANSVFGDKLRGALSVATIN